MCSVISESPIADANTDGTVAGSTAAIRQACSMTSTASRQKLCPPIGPASGDFVDYPSTSTILGAAKLTGRTVSGTSIGMLAAVTGGELRIDLPLEELRRAHQGGFAG